MTNDHENNRILDMEIYAWVGEDELGSGAIGLKQMLMPCGVTPLVATDCAKIDRDNVAEGLTQQHRRYGKRIYLVRFYATEIVKVIGDEQKTEASARGNRSDTKTS